jgi:hypothetical protein
VDNSEKLRQIKKIVCDSSERNFAHFEQLEKGDVFVVITDTYLNSEHYLFRKISRGACVNLSSGVQSSVGSEVEVIKVIL